MLGCSPRPRDVLRATYGKSAPMGSHIAGYRPLGRAVNAA